MPLTASRFIALLLAGASILVSPGTAQSIPPDQQPLYELDTDCSILQGPVQKCLVDVYNQGKITYYRHRIGKQVELIRISDDPENRIERFSPQGEDVEFRRFGLGAVLDEYGLLQRA